MLKRIFKLFQIARKFSTSGAVGTINEIHKLPTSLNLFFNFISIGSHKNDLRQSENFWRKTLRCLRRNGNNIYKVGSVLSDKARYYR